MHFIRQLLARPSPRDVASNCWIQPSIPLNHEALHLRGHRSVGIPPTDPHIEEGDRPVIRQGVGRLVERRVTRGSCRTLGKLQLYH